MIEFSEGCVSRYGFGVACAKAATPRLSLLCVRELQALVIPKLPQGVSVRGHAGLVTNKLSNVGSACCGDPASGVEY